MSLELLVSKLNAHCQFHNSKMKQYRWTVEHFQINGTELIVSRDICTRIHGKLPALCDSCKYHIDRFRTKLTQPSEEELINEISELKERIKSLEITK
jgi:hypothetical protein